MSNLMVSHHKLMHRYNKLRRPAEVVYKENDDSNLDGSVMSTVFIVIVTMIPTIILIALFSM